MVPPGEMKRFDNPDPHGSRAYMTISASGCEPVRLTQIGFKTFMLAAG
jgi:hypothetical protein